MPAEKECDVLILGAGVAGLMAALAALEEGAHVVVAAPAPSHVPGTSCSLYAQGGVAAAGGGDDPQDHAEDTWLASAGLSLRQPLQVLVREAPIRLDELGRWGAPLVRSGGGWDRLQEGGHRRPRLVHADGATTGGALTTFLLERLQRIGEEGWAARRGRVEFLWGWRLHALASDGTRCGGALLRAILPNESAPAGSAAPERRPTGSAGSAGSIPAAEPTVAVVAPSTVLATGGACGLFGRTTNPSLLRGEGILLAYRAGAAVADLEFVQFHPTALAVSHRPAPLLSESLRGAGAHLLNAKGQRFMLRYDPRGELAPRHVVARAILLEMEETGTDHVDLWLGHLDRDEIRRRFPSLVDLCRRHGFDLTSDLLPVAPAAHFFIGGIATGLWGETTVEGLFACGEAACTGLHGADRLGGNSLAECLVFGHRAGLAAARRAVELRKRRSAGHPGNARVEIPLQDVLPAGAAGSRASGHEANLGRALDQHMGVLRDRSGLTGLLSRCAALDPGTVEGGLVRLMATAALLRRESRGTHQRRDAPWEDPAWEGHLVFLPGREEPELVRAVDAFPLAGLAEAARG